MCVLECAVAALVASLLTSSQPNLVSPMPPLEFMDVPRCSWAADRACADVRLRNFTPVVLTDTGFTEHLANTWSPDYLMEHWDDGAVRLAQCQESNLTTVDGQTVFYYTLRLPIGEYNEGQFDHDPSAVTGTWSDMRSFIKGLPARTAAGTAQYLQDMIFQDARKPKSFGPRIVQDFERMDWGILDWLHSEHAWWPGEEGRRPEEQFGPRRAKQRSDYSDRIWMGPPSLVTPLHFDEQHGMLAQVRGIKRLFLWPPTNFQPMALLPWTHPAAAGSHIHDIRDIPPGLKARFAEARGGYVVDLHPGEMLYIPLGWWHHVELVREDRDDVGHPISVSFGYTKDDVVNWEDDETTAGEHVLALKRVRASKVVESHLASVLGGRASVAYFHALDHSGYADGGKDRSKIDVQGQAREAHAKLFDQIAVQLQMMKVLHQDETPAEYLKWMVAGRFDIETVSNPRHHVTETHTAARRRMARTEDFLPLSADRSATSTKRSSGKSTTGKDVEAGAHPVGTATAGLLFVCVVAAAAHYCTNGFASKTKTGTRKSHPGKSKKT